MRALFGTSALSVQASAMREAIAVTLRLSISSSIVAPVDMMRLQLRSIVKHSFAVDWRAVRQITQLKWLLCVKPFGSKMSRSVKLGSWIDGI